MIRREETGTVWVIHQMAHAYIAGLIAKHWVGSGAMTPEPREELLVAAVADCFILSFRAIARTARLEWSTLQCEVDGKLDKIEKFTQFTGFEVRATLTIPDEKDRKKAGVILEKADKYCLVSNSLKAASELTTKVIVEPQ